MSPARALIFFLSALVFAQIPVNASANADQSLTEMLADIKTNTELGFDGEQLDKIFQSVVESRGEKPSLSELAAPLLAGNKSQMSQAVFVFGLFGSAMSGNEYEATSLLKFVELDKSFNDFDDALGAKTQPEQLLEQSYDWIINNTIQGIPAKLVEMHPELIVSTPYWGATRDAYFRIERPDGPTWFDEKETKHWFRLLTDIEMPNKDTWMGSMRNMNFKSQEISAGLVLYAPEWLLKNRQQKEGEPDWLKCWSKLGVYEHYKTLEYLNARKIALANLTEFVASRHSMPPSKARAIANIHIRWTEGSFLGGVPDRLYDPCVEILELNDLNRLSSFDDNSYPEDYRFPNFSLRVKGSFHALRDPEALFELLKAEQPRTQNVFDEVRSFGIVVGDIYDKRLLRSEDHFRWGDFNKSPLAYALQYNNHKAVDWLLEAAPHLMDRYTTESVNWSEPAISNRTPLMYALEYSDLVLSTKIISIASTQHLNTQDSEGRNPLNYLARNERLSTQERQKLVRILFSKGFETLRPSFACDKAQTRYELLACSKESHAALDVTLNKTFVAKKAGLEGQPREDLIRQQKRWLAALEGDRLIDASLSAEFFEIVTEQRIEQLKRHQGQKD